MLDDKADKILIIRLSAIGDIVHSLPTAYAIRQKYPNAQIDWLVEERFYSLVKLNPYIDNVVILPRQKWSELLKNDFLEGVKSIWKFIKKMRKRKYDISLDLQGLFKSSFAGFLFKPNLRMGPSDGRELSQLFYQAKIDTPAKTCHRVEKYLHFAGALDVKTDEVNYGLKITPVIKSRVSRLFEMEKINIDKKIIILNPFTNWKSKNWFLDRYFELANKLIELGYYVIFTGSEEEKGSINNFETIDSKAFCNLAGKTSLEELVEIYRRADLYIGGDTGPTHIAAAVGLKVVALMGPTSPETNGPYGKGHTVIQDNSLKCIRCWDKQCSRNMQCMKSISVDQVLRIARKKIEKNQKDVVDE